MSRASYALTVVVLAAVGLGVVAHAQLPAAQPFATTKADGGNHQAMFVVTSAGVIATGGKPFKDAGATVVAHRRAQERLLRLQGPHTVPADETVDTSRTITLGDTTLELTYLGLNHSDSSTVMRLPKQSCSSPSISSRWDRSRDAA